MSIVVNSTEWIEANRKFFDPPVCNKLMYVLSARGGVFDREGTRMDSSKSCMLAARTSAKTTTSSLAKRWAHVVIINW